MLVQGSHSQRSAEVGLRSSGRHLPACCHGGKDGQPPAWRRCTRLEHACVCTHTHGHVLARKLPQWGSAGRESSGPAQVCPRLATPWPVWPPEARPTRLGPLCVREARGVAGVGGAAPAYSRTATHTRAAGGRSHGHSRTLGAARWEPARLLAVSN